jgi:hypothetical protein
MLILAIAEQSKGPSWRPPFVTNPAVPAPGPSAITLAGKSVADVDHALAGADGGAASAVRAVAAIA